MHHGASIQALGKNLWTPLHFGNPDVVRLLLGSGADLEPQSNVNNTARADLSGLEVTLLHGK